MLLAAPARTELTYLYTPGRPEPTVFEVDGVRFGLAICIEANFPELFAEYERLDVDCVLVSAMVDDPARATVAQAYGTLYNYWLGYAVPAQYAANAPSGIVAPGGRWLHRAPADSRPALAIADLDLHSTEPDIDMAVALPGLGAGSPGPASTPTIAPKVTSGVRRARRSDLGWGVWPPPLTCTGEFRFGAVSSAPQHW
ncbi:carbon-nitrogen hydrolase family protein [Kitasatospora herbaricolor]|uniref:Carbon-nitrogen hydrolase family protein n=1 Tax=Kitasatospora herbaricolor TaxID=68217 RepID=A0ABZ1WKN0_9ACTN|nr:carbon-nitrogen hydrolase family protein [Kitasatospora herbaricolor]